MTEAEKQNEINRRSKISYDEFLTYGKEEALKFLDFIETPDFVRSGVELTLDKFKCTSSYELMNNYLDFRFLRNRETV